MERTINVDTGIPHNSVKVYYYFFRESFSACCSQFQCKEELHCIYPVRLPAGMVMHQDRGFHEISG